MLLSVEALADSLRVDVRLREDGAAVITEVWDVTPYRGTEWYLVRENLGEIRIEDFSVSDETGLNYENIGRWKVDRSMYEKAGKCGIVSKSDGCELCWGIGNYEHHSYTVKYTMTGAVKSLDDYDCLHLQLVSPGIRDVPSDVRVTLSAPVALSTENARVWGFGYHGDMVFSSGKVVGTSSSFDGNSSVIMLLRLDKGIVSPTSTREGDFAAVLDKALKGSDFGDDDNNDERGFKYALMAFFACMGLSIFAGVRSERKRIMKLTGYSRLKDIDWKRDVPFDGDVLKTAYAFKELDRSYRNPGAVASALILRMIQHGQLSVQSEGRRDKVCISFNDTAAESLDKTSRQLYDMMKKAAGDDGILQDKEFSRWNSRNAKEVAQWLKEMEAESRSAMVDGNYMSLGGTFSASGQLETAGAVGFRKFLKDYTLVDERRSAEAVVWNDYLVFGALFGIAQKVAKELADVNPQLYAQTFLGDDYTARRVILISDNFGRYITNGQAALASRSSAGSGFGGGASFGGGGGFSGGGFGGGSR